MNITIRKCMISDAARIRELSKAALGFDYPENKFEESIRRLMGNRSNKIFIAESGNKVLGYAHACDFDILYGPPLKILRAIAVDEKYRRYGVATKLMEEVEKWARDSGAEGVRIYGGSERLASIAFYKAIGYKFVKPESKFEKNFPVK